MTGDLQPPGPPAGLVHLLRGVRGIAIDCLEVIGDIVIREVLQLAAQLSNRAADRHRFVHVASGPFSRPAVVQA